MEMSLVKNQVQNHRHQIQKIDEEVKWEWYSHSECCKTANTAGRKMEVGKAAEEAEIEAAEGDGSLCCSAAQLSRYASEFQASSATEGHTATQTQEKQRKRSCAGSVALVSVLFTHI